jgi:hypothetical protein
MHSILRMLAFGMPVDPTTGTARSGDDRKHANDIWVRYETYRAGIPQGSGYALSATAPFQNWNVSDCYARRSDFDPNLVLEHGIGAEEVCRLIKKAQMDGMI